MAGEITTNTILYASIGGIIPALVWLLFWLHEDYKKPEPTGLIARTFLLGMCAVILVLPLENYANDYFPGFGLMTFIIWAILEEFLKFFAAFISGMNDKDYDEPLDSMVYMITAALGFSAFENALFLLNPLSNQQMLMGLVTGNLRFIGASLLHVVASGVIGFALAYSFYKRTGYKILYWVFGFILAVVLHAAFNIMIINQESLSGFASFMGVWLAAAGLLLSFEKVKTIAQKSERKI